MSCVDLFYESESDEENNQVVAVQRKILRDKSNPLEIQDFLFVKLFRVNKDAFKYLLLKIEGHFNPTVRSSSVCPMLKLAAALRFFAEGSYQTGAGNEYFTAVAQPTFSKSLGQVINIMENELCSELIKFPSSEEERKRIKLSFFENTGFPGMIGCIDGTHVRIVGPPKDQRHLYYNRKGFFSLNVMLVCDDLMNITYVDANHPGSCHDSYIFNSSDLDTQLQREYDNGGVNTWLLGDAGYALKPYVIVPFRTTQQNRNPKEKPFNLKHAKARNIIERTIGVLKNRFRCILGERQLHYSPDKARQIINVCCALHNLCIKYKIVIEIANTVPIDEEELLVPLVDDAQDNAAIRIREQIMNSIC